MDMEQPAFTAAAYPDEYPKIQAFLATASDADLGNACRTAFLFAGELTGSIIYGLPQINFDFAALHRAGILGRYEDLTSPDQDIHDQFFMSPTMRRGVLTLIAGTPRGQEALLLTFLDFLHIAIGANEPPLTPQGVFITPQREAKATLCLNIWKRYTLYVADAVPWPADTHAASYVGRVRALRRLSRYFVKCAWYYIATSRFLDAQNMLEHALKAVLLHLQVKSWSSGVPAEEEAWFKGCLDYNVAIVHAYGEQKVEPLGPSKLYTRFRMEWAARLEQQPLRTPEERRWAMVKTGFRSLLVNMPKVLVAPLSPDFPHKMDVETLIMLAWVDGKWENRLAEFTVGAW